MKKRVFDIIFSLMGLAILSPLLLIVSVLIKLDSNGPVLFRQERVGKDFREFKIYKFRTMVTESERIGPKITVQGDKRITRIGKYLRKYKFDELPQLINVLKGDMSFVGPRPEVRKYVDIFKSDYEKLLKIRPGITDPASMQYSEEEKILSYSTNWEEDYIKTVLPEKIRLSFQYVDSTPSLITDIKFILNTIITIKHLRINV